MESQRAAGGVKQSEDEGGHRNRAEKDSWPERMLAHPLMYRRSPDRCPRGVGEKRQVQSPLGPCTGLN